PGAPPRRHRAHLRGRLADGDHRHSHAHRRGVLGEGRAGAPVFALRGGGRRFFRGDPVQDHQGCCLRGPLFGALVGRHAVPAGTPLVPDPAAVQVPRSRSTGQEVRGGERPGVQVHRQLGDHTGQHHAAETGRRGADEPWIS
ncbi:unnamed protein product, partial [Ectocarpus sp. 8 AP-2014]